MYWGLLWVVFAKEHVFNMWGSHAWCWCTCTPPLAKIHVYIYSVHTNALHSTPPPLSLPIQSAARAHLRAAGFKVVHCLITLKFSATETDVTCLRACLLQDEDFSKPIITIACPYSNALPCNNHFKWEKIQLLRVNRIMPWYIFLSHACRELGEIIQAEIESRGGKLPTSLYYYIIYWACS